MTSIEYRTKGQTMEGCFLSNTLLSPKIFSLIMVMVGEFLFLLLIDPIQSIAQDTVIGSIFSITDGMMNSIPPDSEWAASTVSYTFLKGLVYLFVSFLGSFGLFEGLVLFIRRFG